MPCDTIQESKVTFGANTDRNLLLAALVAAGVKPVLKGDTMTFQGGSYNCKNHEFTFQGLNQAKADERVKEFKRAYSGQVVLSQAKRFGWQVKQTGQYAYEIMKR